MILKMFSDNFILICIQLNGYTYTISFRIAQVTPYAHGTSDLLGIQIDAAINPGLSFMSAFDKKKSALLFCYSLYDEFRALTYLAWDWVFLELMTWFLLCWSFVQETVVGQPLMNKGSALVWHFRYFYSVTLLIARYVMCGYNWFII